jgi:hypothetical protein
MPVSADFERLRQGAEAWNRWRSENPDLRPDLSTQVLTDAPLSGYNLSGAHLEEAILVGAKLESANLEGADLTNAILMSAKLSKAKLKGATLFCANFAEADLSGADLRESNLMGSVLVKTNFTGADLTGSRVYGVAAWDAILTGAKQDALVITQMDETDVTVDHIEMAQFVNLVRRNNRVRDALDALTSKLVLLLGSFSDEQKPILDGLRVALIERHYVPVVFDFHRPTRRDLTETIIAIAALARFVIADITDPRSIPQELAMIVPHLVSLPVSVIQRHGDQPYALYEHFLNFKNVSDILRYRDMQHLVNLLDEHIIAWQDQFLRKKASLA